MSCGYEYNECDKIEMIGGSKRTFEFNAINGETGNQFRLSAYNARFSLTSLTDRSATPVLAKNMTILTESSGRKTGTFRVTLDPVDTYLLSGAFIYQVTIYSPTGMVDTLYQGEIIIYENTDKAIVGKFDVNAKPQMFAEFDYITKEDVDDIFSKIDAEAG